MASEGLAAAETVAAALGRPVRSEMAGPHLVTAAQTPGVADLALIATQAIDRLTGTSVDNELRELWDGSGKGEAWLAAVADLRARLLG